MPSTSVSVVIAVRNGASTLQRALDSVHDQTFLNREIVVMDSESTDGTIEILERNDSRIAYWESKSDRGIYHAWNKALDHVTADWVCFLGADDRFAGPEALAQMAAILETASERYQIVYAAVDVVDAGGTTIARVGKPWEIAKDDFRLRMAIPHQATMHHRSMFARYGRFDDRYRICGDYEFLLRALLEHDPLFVPDLVLVEMDAGGLSSRWQSSAIMTREFHRARYSHGIEHAPEWRSPVVIRAAIHGRLRQLVGEGGANLARDVYRVVARKPNSPKNP